MTIVEDPDKRVRVVTMTPKEKERARNSTSLFLSPEARREVIREVGAERDLGVLIETGTNRGDTPWTLRDSFKQIHTIELDKALFTAAKQRFRGVNNVTCHRGDSTEVLPQILKGVNQSCLVWLDGHYSGPGTALGSESTPIREELGVLFNDRHKHVILVDDARCFYGGAENPYDGEPLWDHYGTYPSLNWVEEQAKAHGYIYELKDDIIRLVPND